MKETKIFLIFFVIIVITLLVLAGCKKVECETDAKCVKQYYIGTCVENKCVYEKDQTYWCGEPQTLCAGKKGAYLESFCNEEKKCVVDITKNKVKLTSLVTEQSLAGDKFKITTEFNQPFNTRKDQFSVKIALSQQATTNSEERITRLELTGVTKDKRTITLAQTVVNRILWEENQETIIPLIINLPSTTDYDGEITNLQLKIYYSYIQTTGGQKQTREATLQNNYVNTKFVWAQPDKPYPCPTTCVEEGPGMQGACNPSTGFCEYTPIAGAKGNHICEANENKCTAPEDCGPCAGSVGVYSMRTCTQDNRCVTSLKQGMVVTPKTIFDDRPLGPFQLQNNYNYPTPFNTKTDKFIVEINLYQIQKEISGVKIETIRLLDGSQQIAELDVNKNLPMIGSSIKAEINVSSQAQPEIDRNLVLGIWYQYTQNNAMQKGNFQRGLEKITLLSPE